MWVWAILEQNDPPQESSAAFVISATSGSVISRTSVETLMAAIGKVVKRKQDIRHYLGGVPTNSAHKKPKGGGNTTPAMSGLNSASNPSSSTSSSNVSCTFCTKKHLSQDCRKYGSLKKRRERLVDLKKCLKCGQREHRAASCPFKACDHCKKENHTIVTCVEYIIAAKAKKKENSSSKSSNSFSISQLTNLEGTFIETFECTVRDTDGNYVNAKGMLDGGCSTSFITNSLANKLKLKRTKRTLSRLCNFGSSKAICQSSDQVEITLKNQCSETKSFRLKTTDCITGLVTCTFNFTEQFIVCRSERIYH